MDIKGDFRSANSRPVQVIAMRISEQEQEQTMGFVYCDVRKGCLWIVVFILFPSLGFCPL